MTETLWDLWGHQSKTSVSDRQGWRHVNQPFKEYLESRNIEAITQDANHSSVETCKEVQRWATQVLEQSFMELIMPRITSTKVMERPMCGERRDVLMFQNIQAHLWLGLAWLLLEWAHWSLLRLKLMMVAAGWILKKHSVCELTEKCIHTNWEELHRADTNTRPKTHWQHNEGLH